MVMRNQNDSPGSSGWWEDLPPKVRARISAPALAPSMEDSRTHTAVSSLPERRGPSGLDWIREFSRLALLFLVVAVANVLFLLVAL